MILYCWRDGALGIGFALPAGALELARGGERAVRAVWQDVLGADPGSAPPCVPGLAEARDDVMAKFALRQWMQALRNTRAGTWLRFNDGLDLRLTGQP